ncbi:MAG: hypothetical protein J7K87_02460 [Candidatus Aenigmarchaeota archaeon]|nr:hypothetical protein [Candidatus Aenigmarchaeota archaeon]
MYLKWSDYPGISKYDGYEEIVIRSPDIDTLIESVENLDENQILVIETHEILNDSREFMKRGPELKIQNTIGSPWKVFPRYFRNLKINRPKRGYKWKNKRTESSVFVPFSSIIDGLKIYAAYDIDVKFYRGRKSQKMISAKVPSRSMEYKYSVFESVLQRDGENFFSDWNNYNCSCGCEGHLYDRFTSFKYVNPENYVCPHIVAAYHAAMKKLPEKGEDPIYPLFPGPTKKLASFDENLTKTFIKKRYKKRLTIGERNFIISSYLGYLNEKRIDGLSFFDNSLL